jgi:uncharacterized protein YndB with AHSA1/START domain
MSSTPQTSAAPSAATSAATLATERVLHASPRKVFQAFQQPELLARWWGPAGFSNTFEQFDFTPGGRWVFVMQGPDGKRYPNECVFRAIEPNAAIVIEHVVAPHFTLSVRLHAQGDNHTRLTWAQTFETEELAAQLRDLVVPANEQNLDRLQVVLLSQSKKL